MCDLSASSCAYMVFGKLNLDGFGVRADWSLDVQGGMCVT